MPMLTDPIAYNPSGASTLAMTATAKMTALDTANARQSPVVPAAGYLGVRMRALLTGSATKPMMLMGILEGATIVARLPVFGALQGITLGTSSQIAVESYAIIPGLSAGSHNLDMAVGCEVVGATGEVIKWGGSGNNDASGNDSFGPLSFDVWDPGANLIDAKLYDPATAVSKSTSLSAMAAIDTTNLRITTPSLPAGSRLMWRARGCMTGSNTTPAPSVLIGLLEGGSIVSYGQTSWCTLGGSSTTFPFINFDAVGVLSGISGVHSYDLSWATQLVGGSTNYKIKYGGPDDTTVNNAWGAISYEMFIV